MAEMAYKWWLRSPLTISGAFKYAIQCSLNQRNQVLLICANKSMLQAASLPMVPRLGFSIGTLAAAGHQVVFGTQAMKFLKEFVDILRWGAPLGSAILTSFF